jgi:hypothetical protein
MSKGSMRRPGKGYEENYERIFGDRCIKHPRVRTTTTLPCPACEYERKKKERRGVQ